MSHRGIGATALLLGFLATLPTSAETPLERGTYLVRSIVACGNCHTPKSPEGEIPGMELAGGLNVDEPPFTAYAANITPDVETGIGSWSDAEIATAIREGRRPDGTIIGPPMPIELYRRLSDTDVAAIVAYLRSVAPVHNVVPDSVYRIPLPPSYGPPVGTVADVPRDDPVAYGAYLAGPAGHCVECHTPMGANGRRDFEGQLGAGGFPFNTPGGVVMSANITPTGLGDWTDDQIKAAITHGVRPDGGRLHPPMGFPYYARMSAADLDALVAYLRSLPPR